MIKVLENPNQILLYLSDRFSNLVKERVNKIINQIRYGQLSHEDDISTALGQDIQTTLEENLIEYPPKKSKNEWRGTIKFKYFRLRGSREQLTGADILWIVNIELKQDDTIYGNVKGAFLQAKKCKCEGKKLATNKFGKWLKENPESLIESCKKMRRKYRSTKLFNKKSQFHDLSISLGGAGYILIYTDDVKCNFRVFGCNNIPQHIMCEGLNILRYYLLHEFVKKLTECKLGFKITEILFNPFFEDIEQLGSFFEQLGLRHIYALKLEIIRESNF